MRCQAVVIAAAHGHDAAIFRMAAIIAAASHALFPVAGGRQMPQAGVLAGADHLLDAGVDAVRGVDVGAVPAPAFGGSGRVCCPQAVPPAVAGPEQGRLGARMRPLAAREDAHGHGPGGKLVPGRAFAQQPGQLGDVRLLDSARRVAAPAWCRRRQARGALAAPGPLEQLPAAPRDRCI
jgi:hypothetical protein